MFFDSGSPEYLRATSPHNSATPQHPALVATPSSAAEVGATIAEARSRGLEIVPQATGHGAGAPVGDGALLLDTSRLAAVRVDPDARVATVGAGTTWANVNAAAERFGLLGLAGSAPTVSVAGYSFAGGVGWLMRRDGMASAAIRRVRYVDGAGDQRVAVEDAADPSDRDALWAFRGAGGVGIATELELDLFPVTDLYAGRLLWPADALSEVVDAWAMALPRVGPSVTSSISVLHVPLASPLPEELRGAVALHLAIADPDGPEGAAELLAAVRAASRPVADDWGPSNAVRLAGIHLDPPGAISALGDARWLDAATPAGAADLLAVARPADSPIVMMELRHVATRASGVSGAVVSAPGPFVYHAVGALGRSSREKIEAGFERGRSLWRNVDTGAIPGSWIEAAASVPGALPPEVRTRAAAIADAVDPNRLIRRSRLLGVSR